MIRHRVTVTMPDGSVQVRDYDTGPEAAEGIRRMADGIRRAWARYGSVIVRRHVAEDGGHGKVVALGADEAYIVQRKLGG